MLDSTHLDPFRTALVEQLTVLRQRAGLSQTALAAELGTDQSTISRVESGARDVDVAEAFAWCEALGLRPSETAQVFETTWVTYGARPQGFWGT